ncbi:hypothetical protein BDV12DRAFT_200702 [Aspergillus spectabilis]
MLSHLAPFLPPAILLGALSSEWCSSSVSRRFFSWVTITAVSLRVILAGSPYTNPLANYITGFFAAWYIIWSANLLLVKDLRKLKRIAKQLQSSPTVYVWQSLPSSHGRARFLWAVDLTLNFRAIGWNFSCVQVCHPPITETQLHTDLDPSAADKGRPGNLEIGRTAFLQKQVRRLAVSGMWLAGYPVIRGALRFTFITAAIPVYAANRGTGSLADLLSVATTLYMFMDGAQAVVSLVAVELLSDEIWRYPPLFGPVETLLSGRLQDVWGKFWHGLLKEGLQATAKASVPWRQPRVLWSLTRIWMCFILTGAVHAAASYTVSREPLPSLCAGVFYCLQPVGIAIQMAITGAMRTAMPKSALSPEAQTVVNYAVGLLWMRYCFPWVTDDPALRQAIGAIRAI